jgi:PAS domain S-box-containing protein
MPFAHHLKLRALAAGSLVILAAIAVFSIVELRQLIQDQAWVAHTHETLSVLNNLEAAESKAESNKRAYALTGDQAFLSEHRTALQEMWSRFDKARDLTKDNPAQQERLSRLKTALTSRVANFEGVLEARSTGRWTPALESDSVEESRPLVKEIDIILTSLESEEQALLVDRRSISQHGQRIAVSIIATGFIAACGMLIASFVGLQKAATKYREQSSLLQSVLDNIADGVIVANMQGHFTLYNRAAATILGQGPADVAASSWSDHFRVFTPDRCSPFPSSDLPLILALQGKSTDRVEMFISDSEARDGKSLLVSGRALRDENGTVRAGVVVFSDYTDLKHEQEMVGALNAELRSRLEDLERASKAKDNFLASMSHELRTPLNAILGFTGVLLMKLPGSLNAEQEKQLTVVQTSARHLLSLINDMLDLTKIEAGRVDLYFEEVHCQAVVEEVVSALRSAAETKGLKVSVDVPDQSATVRTDKRALTQILLNLLTNAIKFTDQGEVSIAVQPGPGELAFRVKDSGLGISKEDQARLFQSFTQVGVKKAGGTGLGLHLSQKLAGMLNGTITVSSEVGKGSEFVVHLRTNKK